MELSVIVISYNEKQFIHQAIESILNQSFKDYEIIIGDDGSDDGSQEIIKDLHEKYPDKIKYFVQERNITEDFIPSIRVSNIIKKAIEKSSGKYIICLSADDYFIDNDLFKTHINNLNIDKEEKYSASVSAFVRIYEDGSIEKNRYRYLPSKLYWAVDYLHLSCFMFRKKIYEQGCFLDNLCDDASLVYSLVCAGEFLYTNKFSFVYRQQRESIMHKADDISLDLLRLMLLQDIFFKNNKLLKILSLSRFYQAITNVYKNNNKIDILKHKKYLRFFKGEKFIINNIIFPNNQKSRHKALFIVIISNLLNIFFNIISKIVFHFYRLFILKKIAILPEIYQKKIKIKN